jgi:ABC-type spermidine/putrescine transport system permease subunit II
LSSASVTATITESGPSLARRIAGFLVKVLVGLAVASVYLFLYAPPIVTAVFSFNSSSIQTLPFAHATLGWYRALFNDPQMQAAIYYSLKIALSAVGVAAVFGVAFALIVHRVKFPGRNVFQALLASPLVTPGMVLGISLLVVFHSVSVAPGFLTIVVGHASFVTPLVTFIVLQRLRTSDPSLEQASMDSGAGPLRTFWHVTLPGIRVPLIAACLLGFTLSMDEITVTFFLAGIQGTLPVYVWGLLRFGFTPEVNAAFTIIGGGSLLLIVIATALLVGAGIRPGKRRAHRRAELVRT